MGRMKNATNLFYKMSKKKKHAFIVIHLLLGLHLCNLNNLSKSRFVVPEKNYR